MKKNNFLKKLSCFLIPVVGLPVLQLSSCGVIVNPDPEVDHRMTVTFAKSKDEIITGSEIESVVKESYFGTINKPIIRKNDYIFNGWSLQKTGEQRPIDPTYKIIENITVYPIWIQDITARITTEIDGTTYICEEEELCDESKSIINLKTFDGLKTKWVYRKEFTTPINVGSDLLYLPNNFMINFPNFNAEITFGNATNPSKLIYIGDQFLFGCKKFNQKLELPGSVKCINSGFLAECDNFNNGAGEGVFDPEKSFIISTSVNIIGSYMLESCINFNQNITFPRTIEYLGDFCMDKCNAFCSTLTMDTDVACIEQGAKYSWSGDNDQAAIYKTGFEVKGKNADIFKETYPDKSGNDPYWPGLFRKISNR